MTQTRQKIVQCWKFVEIIFTTIIVSTNVTAAQVEEMVLVAEKKNHLGNHRFHTNEEETAVAQWLRCCATNPKVAG